MPPVGPWASAEAQAGPLAVWCLGTTMASLWSSLEKDVFNPQKKRLLETICVWKTGKKKKMSILCVVGEKPGGLGDTLSCKPRKVSCSSSQRFWPLMALLLTWEKRQDHYLECCILRLDEGNLNPKIEDVPCPYSMSRTGNKSTSSLLNIG